MRVLVVGGAGFIGSNLVSHLIDRGHKVVYSDIYWHDPKQNMIPGGVEVPPNDYRGDYDIVYWLGGKSSAPMFRSFDDVAADVRDFGYFLDNVRTKRLVVASTSSFYEDPPSLENEIIRPKSFYEVDKKCFEEMACCFARRTGITTAVARFFSVYGPGESHKRQYANLITQAIWSGLPESNKLVPDGMCNMDFEIYGDGSQTRDFTHVLDIVQGLEILGTHDAVKNYGIYNVGTGKSYTMNEIAEYIKSKMGGFEYKWVPNRISHYVTDTLADIDKIRKLGYSPKIEVWRGIDMTIEHYGGGGVVSR